MVNITKLFKCMAIMGVGAGVGLVAGKKISEAQFVNLLNENSELRDAYIEEMISRIISTYDHDLSEDELFIVRDALRNPSIMLEFLNLIGENSVKTDKQLIKKAQDKVTSLIATNKNVNCLVLNTLFVTFNQPRRINAYSRYILDNNTNDIIEILQTLETKFPKQDEQFYEEIIKAFDLEPTEEEKAANGIRICLERKQTSIASKNLIKWMQDKGAM